MSDDLKYDIQNGILYAENVEAYVFTATSDYRIKENPILLNDTFYVDDLKPRFYKIF
jgi:hypothetical protein